MSAQETEPAVVTVSGTGESFLQAVEAGRHRFRSDEPVAAGGTDAAPGPYDLLLAALGSCTSMTIGMYARHKGWTVHRIRVRLSHRRIHARDCEDCESGAGMLDLIEREIELQGPLDETQRARLIDIANKCPVHRTLSSEIRIRTREIGP